MTVASSFTYVDLTNGGFALVDDADLRLIQGYRWRWRKRDNLIYVVASGENANGTKGGEAIRLHRLIMGATDPEQFVDHINGNGLDNRRSNLRLATNSENQRNRHRIADGSSPLKGVTWHRKAKQWQAQIKIEGKNIYLGLFRDEKDAARAYDEAARELFGEFAAVNFPEKGEAA